MQLTKLFKSSAKQVAPCSYLETCTQACSTREGAGELASRLKREMDAAPLSDPCRRMFRPQIEAAQQAGEHAQVMHDVEVRIPAAFKRAEAVAEATKNHGQSEIAAGEKAAGVAAARLANFKSQFDAAQAERDGVQTQVSEVLGSAQQALDALFGGPAPRSSVETSALSQAGTPEPGIRSSVGDEFTFTVDKGTATRTIIAAPEGDGQAARVVIPS